LRTYLQQAADTHLIVSAVTKLNGTEIVVNGPFYRQRRARQRATLFHEFLHLLGWTDDELQARLCGPDADPQDTSKGVGGRWAQGGRQ
jgi:hypothetical protein